MDLASDVHDRNGRLLLGAGAELTEKHIHIFRTWGVLEVDIEGVDGAQDNQPFVDAIDPEAWAAAEAGIAPRFRHVDRGHPAMIQLYHLGILNRVKNGIR